MTVFALDLRRCSREQINVHRSVLTGCRADVAAGVASEIRAWIAGIVGVGIRMRWGDIWRAELGGRRGLSRLRGWRHHRHSLVRRAHGTRLVLLLAHPVHVVELVQASKTTTHGLTVLRKTILRETILRDTILWNTVLLHAVHRVHLMLHLLVEILKVLHLVHLVELLHLAQLREGVVVKHASLSGGSGSGSSGDVLFVPTSRVWVVVYSRVAGKFVRSTEALGTSRELASVGFFASMCSDVTRLVLETVKGLVT